MSRASSLARIKAAIADALGFTPVNKAGDTMSGALNIGGSVSNAGMLGVTGSHIGGHGIAKFKGLNGPGVVVIDSGDTSSVSGLRFHSNGADKSLWIYNPVSDDVSLENASGQKLLSIHNTTGRVTMPYQPCFYATTDGIALNGGYSSATTMPYADVKTNIGSGYSAQNKRFTAPVAGAYLISASVSFGNATSNNVWVAIRIRKNGAYLSGVSYSLGHVSNVNGNQYDDVSQTVILSLSAGDYVDVACEHNTFNGNAAFGHFSGHLIG